MKTASPRGASPTPAKPYAPGLNLLERQESEDQARIEWLRGAVQEGLDQLERADYTALRSPAEVDRFIDEIRIEVLAEHGGRTKGV